MNPYVLSVGVQINAAIVETSLETSRILKIELVYMPQLNSSWANTQRTSHPIIEIFAPLQLLLLYSFNKALEST